MGTYLSTPVLEKDIDSGQEAFDEGELSVSWACVEMQGWRKTMEDAHIAHVALRNPGNDAGGSARVFGAFDGHGGGEVARFCKEHFVNVLTNREEWAAGAVGKALKETFLQLDCMIDDPYSHNQLLLFKNQRPPDEQKIDAALISLISSPPVAQVSPKNPNSSMTLTNSPTRLVNGRQVCNLPDHPIHAGCTSIVCVIHQNQLTVANAGDSRAVLCRANQAMALSTDHKPLNDDEMLRIQQAGGFVNHFGRINGNLNVSRSIGDLKYKQAAGILPSKQMITADPDILEVSLLPDDEFILIGCDGIWDCISNQECVDFVLQRIDTIKLSDIGIELLDKIVSKDPRATQGIGGDNMTFLIVDLKSKKRTKFTNPELVNNDTPEADADVIPPAESINVEILSQNNLEDITA